MINTFYFNGLIFIQLKRLLILSFIFLLNITISQEEKRLALVIGNANYDKAALKNPVNDALLMKETLEKLNFDVIYDTNIEKEEGLEDIIDSKNAFGIEVFNKKNKSIKKLEMSKKGIYYFTINPEKKDIFKIGLIDSIDKSKSSTSTSYTYIFSYEIK